MTQFIAIVQRYLFLEGLEKKEDQFVVRAGIFIAMLAVALRLVFWVYTQRYWDDALIACLHSENWARGLGLTHAVSFDNPLQGFTSPLGVLIPMLGDWVHIGWGIELMKVASMAASALSVLVVLALGIHQRVRLATPLLLVAMAYVAIEHHQILWGMAGMESQLAVLSLLLSIYYTVTLRAVPLGLSLAFCMLVRPDFAIWTVISGVYVLCQQPRSFLKVVGVALGVYLPWVCFTFVYFGSAIPHTIIAKGVSFGLPWLREDSLSFFSIKRHTWMMLSEQLNIHLGPAFEGHGAGIHKFFTTGPESIIANIMFCFAVVGTITVVVKRQWALWPLCAFVVLYSAYYVYLVPIIYGWYKVPFTVALLLLSLWGIHQLSLLIPRHPWRNRLLAGFAVVYMGAFALVLPRCFYAERMIQSHIENDVRREAGLYLQAHMTPEETVGTEALGYIAYYSQGRVYDWPGLASREVVEWSREQPAEARTLENMCRALKPEYLFLRDLEVLYNFHNQRWLEQEYHVVAVFEVDPDKRESIPWIRRSIDPIFRIYKRNGPGDEVPYDTHLFPRRTP